MTFDINVPPCFTHLLENLLKKFPKSKIEINEAINSLKDNPFQGDRVPGFGKTHLRKLRISLKEYNIGKRGGLRVLFLIDELNKSIVLIAVYYKGEHKSESSTLKLIKNNLKSILQSG